MATTFESNVWSTPMIYRDAQNWIAEALEIFLWLKLFTRISDSRAPNIDTLEIEHGRSRQIETAISFDSNVWSTRMIYRDSQNWTTEALRNSNDHNFWLVCMMDAHDITRRSKLNNGSSWKVQMAITFDSNVWSTPMIWRDSQNRTTKYLEKFKWPYLLTRMYDRRPWYIETLKIE